MVCLRNVCINTLQKGDKDDDDDDDDDDNNNNNNNNNNIKAPSITTNDVYYIYIYIKINNNDVYYIYIYKNKHH
jgi:hypothetical protein